jgi:hypothetical protein
MVFDDCYLCNWIMVGPWVRKGGERSQEMWCGAGRPEFNQDGLPPCPTRLEKVELILNFDEHSDIVFESDAGSYVLDEVDAWLKVHAPDTTIEPFQDELLFTFASPKEAIHFKMKWF